MIKKYENRTYTDNIQNEISDLEIQKKNSENIIKKENKQDSLKNHFLETTFQPKCIFTKENNNISFYQSNSRNSYRSTTYKNKKMTPVNTKNSTNKSNKVSSLAQSLGEEAFSYNFNAIKRKNSNVVNKKNENFNTDRININQLSTKLKKPRKTIKSCKKENSIQNTENLNMIPNNRLAVYDSDINLNLKKPRSKINQMYKKQDVEEIYFPSKKTHSPPSSIQNEEIVNKYQTHTLKYQSFFGSFNGLKNSRVTKSSSRLRVNQLNDFNIDKLIEIGDKYVNLKKPVLPLGRIMNNNILYYNKNRIKHIKNKIPINSKIFNNKYSYDVQVIPNFFKFNKKDINKDSEEKDENKTDIKKDNKRVIKKIIYKNNLKNNKNNNNENKIQNQPNSVIMKNLDFFDPENNENLKISKISRKFSKNDTNQPNFEKNTDKNNNEIQNNYKIAQNEKLKKKLVISNFGQKRNSINIDDNNNNKKEKSYIIMNRRNEKQTNKNILYEPKLLTDDESNYRNKKVKNKGTTQNKEILVTEGEKYIKNNKYSNNFYYNETKNKNYYGYDERHNLEDTIDNHAYYESVHSRKKPVDLVIDKII